ncbi:hypothetical protein BDV93DRAFT_579642 [Ceratobasidium sp. AG-I]|nr:hypothetical protein BDV93DRAFT_579642 [Ceratobasidium sp. AG-I]
MSDTVAMSSPTNKNSFNTMDVRAWEQPQLQNSKEITETVHSTTPPIGLNWLDMKCKANKRIRSYIDNVATDPQAKVKGIVHLDSWHDTVLYSAGCTWLDVCKHDRDFQFGTYATGELSANPNKPSTPITFDRPYASVPNIIVWIKDLDLDKGTNYRVKTYATNITRTGFTLNVETWGDTKLYNAGVTWIAHAASRSNIASGGFHTNEIRPYTETKQQEHMKAVKFDKKFEGKPDVYVGFSQIDSANDTNLRLKAFAKDVTTEGMNLHINTWFDTVLYQAEASWLAIQEC